ncbi:hypothetical protein [Halobacterium wangiae]|uniref:hypothetical protein n=1 Tax=Halobacterium wangiae TaxID=2902623 RepID=UPI001E46BBDC|nr:hypothetical protein [Halobacterium wangiae]
MTDDGDAGHAADVLDGAGLDAVDGDVLDALVDGDADGDGSPSAEPSLFDGPAEFDDAGVQAFLRSAPDSETLRPALQRLTADQRALIGSFVDGFKSRAAFLEWCQDAAIRTLGELDGEWFRARAFTRLDLSVLVTTDARERYAPESGDVLSRRQAAGVRRGVVLADILPACASAYRRLRWSATEYVNDADDSFVPDPDVQEHTAMRPALTELDERQGWAIRRLLNGLPSEDALFAWLQAVTEASYAEVDGDLGRRLNGERRARAYLLDDIDDAERHLARWFRESFAAHYVLPGFAEAASEVGKRAGELAERDAEDLNFPKMG